MKREKVLKILEKILIFIVTLIMILVMANQYIKTSHSARNETIILAQIILIIFAAIISLIMSIIDKNKTLTIALLVMYLLSGGLFLIFKNAGRI